MTHIPFPSENELVVKWFVRREKVAVLQQTNVIKWEEKKKSGQDDEGCYVYPPVQQQQEMVESH